MSFSIKLILGWFLHLVPVMTHCRTPALNYQSLDDSKQKYWSEEIQIGASWGPLSLCLRLSHRRSLLMQSIKHPAQRRVDNWFSPPLTRRRLCLCTWCGEIAPQQISSENTYYAGSLCIAFMWMTLGPWICRRRRRRGGVMNSVSYDKPPAPSSALV